MRFPLSRPDVTQREIDAVTAVMRSDTLSIGPVVVEFERACAAAAGRKHGIAVSSGTAGLHALALSLGWGEGDEIVTTPFSFVASANCILMADATPVFADIDERTLNLDPAAAEAAITPRTRGLLGVEAFGNPAGVPDVADIARRRGLTLIEDCCEGFGGSIAGRPIGSFGDGGVFGFYPNKQITTGEGGMIVTDRDDLADLCRSYRNQGRDGMAWLAHARLGYNYRLSEINAAIGLVQVQRLGEITAARRRVAAIYDAALASVPHVLTPRVAEPATHSWFVYVIRLDDALAPRRDDIIHALRQAGVGCNIYFPPIHLQPYMVDRFGFRPGMFPVCEKVSRSTIALPFHNKMTEADVAAITTILRGIVESHALRAA